jgi:hypothetical protein
MDPCAGGDLSPGTLLFHALEVDRQFWQEHPELWSRLLVILIGLYAFREFIERERILAAEQFEAARPDQSP